MVDYNRAIEINPGYVDAYYNRALVRRAAGSIDDYTQEILLEQTPQLIIIRDFCAKYWCIALCRNILPTRVPTIAPNIYRWQVVYINPALDLGYWWQGGS